jgi:DNA-binding transcriptional ArsR family regulator
MSPNTNTNISWDPSRLRLDQDGVRRLQGGIRRGRRVSPIRGKFIAGPIDVSWVVQASRLGVKALLVGLALWHLKKLRQADTFIVSNLIVHEWGVQPDAKRRALRALERAGLIRIERREKRSPQVTLVVENRFEGGKVAVVENSGQPRTVAGPCNRETPGKE